MSGVVEMATILVAAIGAQWLAWRLHLPSIIVLLATGLAIGPGLGWVDVDHMLGDNLEPFIALAVAVILFEGGLGLRWKEIRAHGPVVFRLITIGVTATAMVATAAGTLLLDLPLDIALLLGAILTVSGPTVVLPLLAHVRAEKQTSAILRWEGILVDPVGAILALVVLQVILAGGSAASSGNAILSFLQSMAIGSIVGAVLGLMMAWLEARFWVPDRLAPAVGLAAVVGGYALSDMLLTESGLVAVTVMGIVLANQRIANIRHLLDFKEHLSKILLGLLFIILAARVPAQTITNMDPMVFAFVGVLVLVARPIAVALSTLGAGLSLQQRAFLAWMAPRGIVAAAVSAFFAIRLEEAGRAEGAVLVPITFLTIVMTVLLYALTARPVAKLLGVAGPAPRGVLIIGANKVARAMASALGRDEIPYLMVDINRESVAAASTEGLHAVVGDALDPEFEAKHEIDGLGTLWAMTPNQTTNSLAAVHFSDTFGRGRTYQIPVDHEASSVGNAHLRGRYLWDQEATYRRVHEQIKRGWRIANTYITADFSSEDWRQKHGEKAVWLATLRTDGRLRVVAADETPIAEPGDHIIGLVPPREDKPTPPVPVDDALDVAPVAEVLDSPELPPEAFTQDPVTDVDETRR